MTVETVRLKEVCKVIMGQAPKGSSYNSEGSGLPLLAGAGDLGELEPVTTRFTSEPTRIAETGDIILCVRATLGKTNWARRTYCLGRGVASLRANPQQLDSGYLWHWIATQGPNLERQARGSTFRQVTRDTVESLRIPLPPLPEQRRIAAILDKADAVRRKRQQTLDLADQFLRSAFLDMFGDPVTNPKGWEVRKLGELLVFLTSGSRGWAKYYSEDGAAFLRIQNVGRNRLLIDDLAHVVPPDTKEAERTRVQPGDVVLSITADLGRAAVISDSLGPAHVNQHLGLLRAKGVDPVYLAEFLISDAAQLQFRALDTGQTRSGLNFNDLKRLKILLPPMELQRRFASLYGRTETSRIRRQRALAETGKSFHSLIQRAFRGGLS